MPQPRDRPRSSMMSCALSGLTPAQRLLSAPTNVRRGRHAPPRMAIRATSSPPSTELLGGIIMQQQQTSRLVRPDARATPLIGANERPPRTPRHPRHEWPSARRPHPHQPNCTGGIIMQQQQTSRLAGRVQPTEFFLPQTSRQDIRTALVRSCHTGSFIRITSARPLPGSAAIGVAPYAAPVSRGRALRHRCRCIQALSERVTLIASDDTWIEGNAIQQLHDRQARRHAPRRRHARPASGSRLSGGPPSSPPDACTLP